MAVLVIAVILPLAAPAQEVPPQAPPAAPKYEVYVGVAYSRIRQVPVTYSGLIGGKASLARDWGKYFQLIGSVDYYKMGTGHAYLGSSRGNPSMYTFMLGPGLHAPLFAGLSGDFFGEVGGEHTGGEQMDPTISFAGGFGGGLTYDLTRKFGLRLAADRVGASFSLPNNTPQLAYSTHRTWNARYTFGVVYRF